MTDPAVCSFCGRAVEGPESFCAACDSAVDIERVLGVLPAPPPRTVLPPREIGRFRVVRPVGEGGAGVVYEALDPMLGRSVALKLLKPLGLSADILERFLREARVLARFRHPHVVQIFELGRHGGRDYLAMEFVEGKPFPATTDLREAVKRLAVIARALGHVHAKGIVHRDVKPTNILVEAGGRPVLMDFGIARSGGISSTLSASGMVLGTPGYMAPEQLAGELDQIGPLADVYALGVLLYEILAGRRPYEGRTVVELADRIRQGRPPSPRSLRAGVPVELEAVCLKAMALDPAERYPTAYAFAEELERHLGGRPTAVRPTRKRLPWMLAAAALVAALTAAVWFARPSPPLTKLSGSFVSGDVEPGRAEVARAREMLAQRPAAPDELWGTHLRAEAALRKASALSPRLVDAPRELARLYAERGRFEAAHGAWRRVLELDPTHAEAKIARSELLLTEQIVLHVDRLHFPEVTRSLQARLARQAGPLDPFGAAVARADWDQARRHAPAGAGLAVDVLSGRRRPLAAYFAARTEDPPSGEAGVWWTLVRAHERRALAPRLGSELCSRHPLHAGVLRLAAELEPDETKALRLLDQALQSDPRYLQARLARAKLTRAAADRADALRLARTLHLEPEAVSELEEILR